MAKPFKGVSKKARQRRSRRERESQGAPGPSTGTARKTRQERARRSLPRSLEKASYLQSVMDPENGFGAKIPDLSMLPTCTFQTTLDYQISAGNYGDAAFAVDLGLLQCWYPATNASYGNITWAGASALPGRAGIVSNFGQLRPVSAVLKAEWIGSSSADQGQVCGAWIPSFQTATGITSFVSLLSVPYQETFPARNGCYTLYYPMDDDDLRFNTTGTSGYPKLLIWASGLSSAAPVGAFRIRLVINYEAIPTTDTLNYLTPTPEAPKMGDIADVVRFSQMQTGKVGPLQGVFKDAGQTAAQFLASMPGPQMVAAGAMMGVARAYQRGIGRGY